MPAHAINAVEKPATRKFWRSLINKLKPTKKRDCTCAVCLYRDAVNMGVVSPLCRVVSCANDPSPK